MEFTTKEISLIIDTLRGAKDVLDESMLNFEDKIYQGKEVTELECEDYKDQLHYKGEILELLQKIQKEVR